VPPPDDNITDDEVSSGTIMIIVFGTLIGIALLVIAGICYKR
jgi:hypothetical protein